MSAVYANNSNQVAALKELYDGGDYLKDLVYKKNPWLALVKKNESPDGFAGKYIPVPTIFGNPQGRSATFATAQANQTATNMVSFFVYSASNYELVTIQNQLMEQTKNNAASFIDAAKLQMDTGVRNLTNNIASDLFGNGSGAIGTIASITTGVIVLGSPQQVTQFEVGQVLQSFSISGTTATVVTGGALGYVIAVNRSFTAPSITVSATQGGSAGTPTNWATGFPNLAVQGDVNFASGGLAISSSGALKMPGLSAWLPQVAPTSGDSFWGVDRSVDSRLYGVIVNGSAEPIEEALIDLATGINLNGGEPDLCLTNFTSYASLLKSVGSKVQYVQIEHDMADISFKALQLQTPYGPIPVVPDRSAPGLSAYMLQSDSWCLRTTGKCPHVLTYGAEGLTALRVGSADALEVRWGNYGSLICNAPGYSGVVSLSQ